MQVKEYYNEEINERAYFSESNNGIKVFYFPKTGYTKKQAVFSTKYGSIDNKFIPIGENEIIEVPEGIAHFLEHKLFEEPKENIFDIFSNRGASVNAFTSFNQTSYLFNSTDYFYENLETLIKFVQNPYLTDENVDKEKGIITQEINMYRDNPGWRVYFNLLEAMYVNHPVKIDIAGTEESIKTINKDLLYKSYNTFYHPHNMVLILVGDLDFKRTMETVNASEKTYDRIWDKIQRFMEEEPQNVNKKRIDEYMVTSAPTLFLGFKDLDIGSSGSKKIKNDIITNILLDMLLGSSSNFFNKLYNKGLIDGGFGGYYTSKSTYGHSIISGETMDPETLYEEILELISQPTEKVLNIKDFNRLKKNETGGFLTGFNSINFIANNSTDLYFDDFMILDYLDLMKSIKFEEVVEKFENHFREDRASLSILWPKKLG